MHTEYIYFMHFCLNLNVLPESLCSIYALYWFGFVLLIDFIRWPFLLFFSFSFFPSFFFWYLVTVRCRKAQFLHRDPLISPSSPNKALLRASVHCVIRIYCTVAQWFWFSASKTMHSTFGTLVKGVNGIWNELQHQSVPVIHVVQAESRDSLFDRPK